MLLYILNRFGNMGLLPTSAGISLNPKFYTQNPKPQTLDMGLLPTSAGDPCAPVRLRIGALDSINNALTAHSSLMRWVRLERVVSGS